MTNTKSVYVVAVLAVLTTVFFVGVSRLWVPRTAVKVGIDPGVEQSINIDPAADVKSGTDKGDPPKPTGNSPKLESVNSTASAVATPGAGMKHMQSQLRASYSVDSATIPSSVRAIVPRSNADGPGARLSAVHSLGNELTHEERKVLYAFLLDPDRVNDLHQDREYVLVNEIMNNLRRQADAAPEFGTVLAAIYRNSTHASVVRDYAIQHLGEWSLVNQLEADIEAVFYEALTETQHSIAGTSLIALDKLATESQKLSPDVVERAAILLASDVGVNAGSRAAAIATCGRRGLTNVLEEARKFARESSIPLSLASIAYVGSYGQADDRLWLNEISTGSPAVTAAAAMGAINNINARTTY